MVDQARFCQVEVKFIQASASQHLRNKLCAEKETPRIKVNDKCEENEENNLFEEEEEEP
jgi:hypothetical protein